MLQVEDIHFAYDGRPVLRGVDLRVGPGEVVGVVGPNGAGKSTLLRLVSGVLTPQGGHILIGGRRTSEMRSGELARQVAVVPQTPTLPPTFIALDLVLMGRTPHLRLFQWEGETDLRIVREAMEETDCWPLAHRPVGTLSGGERQRLLIARALAQEAPLLLLDEPTASLDLGHQTGVLDLVERVQRRRGGAVLMAIHDLSLAAQYCHRIALLHQGRIFASGLPGDVLTLENVRHVYGTEVCIISHPARGTPVVLPVASGDGPARGGTPLSPQSFAALVTSSFEGQAREACLHRWPVVRLHRVREFLERWNDYRPQDLGLLLGKV